MAIPAQFSVPQIEYPLGGSSKKGSHVYFLLQVFRLILLLDINVVLMLPWWSDVTIVESDVTIVVPWQLSTGSKHDYLFCYCPLVGILFEVLRIVPHLQCMCDVLCCITYVFLHLYYTCSSIHIIHM